MGEMGAACDKGAWRGRCEVTSGVAEKALPEATVACPSGMTAHNPDGRRYHRIFQSNVGPDGHPISESDKSLSARVRDVPKEAADEVGFIDLGQRGGSKTR